MAKGMTNTVVLRLPLVPAAGLLLALAMGSARGQETGKALAPEAAAADPGFGATTLPPMFVTTLRTVADPIEVPYAADVVGAAEFERLQPRSTPRRCGSFPR